MILSNHMPNPFAVPEISVQETAKIQNNGASFVWLDVREPAEYAVRIGDDRVKTAPLSQLAAEQLSALPPEALDKDAELIVFCHHGVRSAQVVAWLQQQGWTNALNMAGGIDAWAKEIDPSIGTY